jgi:hypothetical protein
MPLCGPCGCQSAVSLGKEYRKLGIDNLHCTVQGSFMNDEWATPSVSYTYVKFIVSLTLTPRLGCLPYTRSTVYHCSREMKDYARPRQVVCYGALTEGSALLLLCPSCIPLLSNMFGKYVWERWNDSSRLNPFLARNRWFMDNTTTPWPQLPLELIRTYAFQCTGCIEIFHVDCG